MSATAARDTQATAFTDPDVVRDALARTPEAAYIMTSAYELARAGVVVRWVQRAAEEPLLVSVALRKGHPIEMLIRDSHCFALCRVPEDDPALLRRFEAEGSSPINIFDTLDVETLVTGAPCLKRASLIIDCEVHRHLDIDADHEIYVGLVREAKVCGARAPSNGAAKPPRSRTRATS
ncbi:MAG: flavin reductase [Phycisphaerales bacterium]